MTESLTIWKYELSTIEEQSIPMPIGASVLSAGLDVDGALCLWVKGNPDKGTEMRTFNIFGTGHILDTEPRTHIGTVKDKMFVWHVFENLMPVIG